MESHILQTVNILVESISKNVSQLARQVEDMGNAMSIMREELDILKRSAEDQKSNDLSKPSEPFADQALASGKLSTQQVLERFGRSQTSQPYLMKQNGAIAPARFGMTVKQPDQIRKAMDNAQKAAEAVSRLVEKTKSKEVAKKIKFRNNSIFLILLPDFDYWTPELRGLMMQSKFCITIQDDYFNSTMSAEMVSDRLVKMFQSLVDLEMNPFAWCSLKGNQNEIKPLSIQSEDCYRLATGKQLHTFTDSGGSKGAVLIIKLLNEPDEDRLRGSEMVAQLRTLLAGEDPFAEEEEVAEFTEEGRASQMGSGDSDVELVDKIQSLDEIMPKQNDEVFCKHCDSLIPGGLVSKFLVASAKADLKLSKGNLPFHAEATVISEICNMHKIFEYKLLGRKNNWPMDSSSFEKDSKWIVQKEAAEKLTEIIRDPTVSKFFTRLLTNSGPKDVALRKSARVNASATTVVIPKVRKRKQFSDSEDSVNYMPGYYGDQGYFMFSTELSKKFSGMINDVGLARASSMSSLDFVQMVLVPEACVLLFQKRLHGMSRENALQLREESTEYGRIMFPSED